MKPKPVIFITTNFSGNVVTGPNLYSEHIWRFFHNDPAFDLHVIATETDKQSERIHLAPAKSGPGFRTYSALEATAEELLVQLGGKPIVHVNAAHMITPGFAQRTAALVQVNDTEVCSWKPSFANLRRHGVRRNVALCWRQRRERAVVKNAGKAICNSHHTAQTICRCYRIESSRVKMIYKAVNLAPFNRAQGNFERPNARGPRQLVFVGANWRRKGLDVLFRAIALLRKHKFEMQLQVLGIAPKSINNEFSLLADKLGIAENVFFGGILAREKLPSTLARADMLVLPSREEALGLVAIEALASGIPVVASNVGGLPEIISNEDCGQLVPPGDALALADAIERVLKYPMDAHARRIRQQAVERFGAERLEGEIRELYSRVDQC